MFLYRKTQNYKFINATFQKKSIKKRIKLCEVFDKTVWSSSGRSNIPEQPGGKNPDKINWERTLFYQILDHIKL